MIGTAEKDWAWFLLGVIQKRKLNLFHLVSFYNTKFQVENTLDGCYCFFYVKNSRYLKGIVSFLPSFLLSSSLFSLLSFSPPPPPCLSLRVITYCAGRPWLNFFLVFLVFKYESNQDCLILQALLIKVCGIKVI